MKKIFVITSLMISIILSGCAGSSFVKPTEKSTNSIEFSKEVVSKMASPLYKWARLGMLNIKENKTEHYTILTSKFYPVDTAIRGVEKSFEAYCKKIGGQFYNYRGCIAKNDLMLEEALFYTRISTKMLNSGYQRVNLTVVQPNKDSSLDNREYYSYIKKLGYKPLWQVKMAGKQNELKRQEEKRQKEQLESDRIKRELPYLKTVGTHICKKQNSTYFSGYVEKVAGNKIQIRVNRAGFGSFNSNLQRGGFDPEIIWDNPSSWHVCK